MQPAKSGPRSALTAALAFSLIWSAAAPASAQIRFSAPAAPGIFVPAPAASLESAGALPALPPALSAPLEAAALPPLPETPLEDPEVGAGKKPEEGRAPYVFGSLKEASDSIAQARPGAGPESSLSSLFENSLPNSAALQAVGETPALRPPARPRRGRRARAERPDWPPSAAPGRALKIGLAAAAVMVALQALPLIAEALGYASHPNYHPPGPAVPAVQLEWGPLLRDLGRMTILGPMVEEAVFRSGLMRGIYKLSEKSKRINPLWVSALVSSAVFAALHETSDPLYFAARFSASLMLSWAYQKGGWRSSTAAHGIYNGLVALPSLARILFHF